MTILFLIAIAAIVGVLVMGTAIQVGLILAVGALSGFLARAVIPGRQEMSLFQTIFLGVGGMALMAVVGALLGFELDAGIWTGAVGATIILALYLYLKSQGLLCIGGLILALSCSGCATRPDPTPKVAETRAVSKVVGTPVVFTFGVVTWPVGIMMACSDADNDLGLRSVGLGWPFYMVAIYWDDSL
jgi:uncharacterized membrane protein YeaQ/YmgE (transglycosylase-associated protein family)